MNCLKLTFCFQVLLRQQNTLAPLEHLQTALVYTWKVNAQIVIRRTIVQGVKLHPETNAHLAITVH